MPKQVLAKLVKKEEIIKGIYKFSVKASEIVESAKPGNFIEIRVTDQVEPFLRRPISIYNLDKKNGILEFIFQVKGKGTQVLSRKEIGDKIDIIGPLGYGTFKTDKYRIIEPIPYESLTEEMMLEISHQVKIKCKKYVVGALFEDTNRLFYSFSKKEEWLQINPVMYEFICKHKVVIEKLNYYEWARFLERVNEEAVATKLLDKIDESAKRNNLSAYRQILYEEFESKNCFYCGRPLQAGKIDVDHFIPWSFIKDDNLWNLVLSCPTCNRKKNDRLPDGRFLTDIIDRNQHILIESHRPEMQNYYPRMISYVYNWAKMNGYDRTWQPDMKAVLAK